MNPTRLLSRRALAVVAALAFSACSTDDLLDVENPDGIDPGAVNNPTGATAMYAGALAELANAHDGGGGAQGLFGGVIMTSGLFSDEFRFGGTPPEVRQVDLTSVTKENSFFRTTYLQLHVAREAAERAAGLLQTTGSGPDRRIGEMFAVSGFVVNVFGELFCSGIPFSSSLSGELVYGEPLSSAEVFALALEKLQAATNAAAGDARVIQFAAVVRGRALINAGQFAQAAQAVAAVPTNFIYFTSHDASPERVQNYMKAFIFDFDYMSVSDLEGTNGLNYATAGDPRVVTNFAGPSRFDGETPHYQYLLYDTYSAPVILASGVEARLIEAEAAYRAGDFVNFKAKLDAARAFHGMPPVADPGTAAGRVDLLFRERAFSLFATGHRVGDMRRLVTQYGRAANTVYPIGPYHKDNLTRGADRSFVIPTSEENNPNYSATGCNKLAP